MLVLQNKYIQQFRHSAYPLTLITNVQQAVQQAMQSFDEGRTGAKQLGSRAAGKQVQRQAVGVPVRRNTPYQRALQRRGEAAIIRNPDTYKRIKPRPRRTQTRGRPVQLCTSASTASIKHQKHTAEQALSSPPRLGKAHGSRSRLELRLEAQAQGSGSRL